MATIQANVHKDLPEFLTALAAANAAGDKFDTENLTRALIPNRALSTMPKADLVPDSGVTLPSVTPTADGWLYAASFPQDFGQFLMDFQSVAAAGRSVDSVVMTRTKLKPYAVLNVKFAPLPVKSVTAKVATISRAADSGAITAATLWSFVNSTASDYNFTSSDTATATVTAGGAVTPVAAGTSTVTVKLKGTTDVLATITVTVTA